MIVSAFVGLSRCLLFWTLSFLCSLTRTFVMGVGTHLDGPGSSSSADPYIYSCKQKTVLFFSGNGYRFLGPWHDISVLWLLSLCTNYLPYMKWNVTDKPIIYYYMNIPISPIKGITQNLASLLLTGPALRRLRQEHYLSQRIWEQPREYRVILPQEKQYNKIKLKRGRKPKALLTPLSKQGSW